MPINHKCCIVVRSVRGVRCVGVWCVGGVSVVCSVSRCVVCRGAGVLAGVVCVGVGCAVHGGGM
jgi:hypothetical protein